MKINNTEKSRQRGRERRYTPMQTKKLRMKEGTHTSSDCRTQGNNATCVAYTNTSRLLFINGICYSKRFESKMNFCTVSNITVLVSSEKSREEITRKSDTERLY